MLRQLQNHSMSEGQLIHEVRRIYSNLVELEKSCIEVDKQLLESGADLPESQCQVLLTSHENLFDMHYDFFMTSEHPSAGPALKGLGEEYIMPACMWKYGIHSFLEILRQKLPASLEHIFRFIYFAYSMITSLLESTSVPRGTWILCLGDLARYGMAIQADMGDRQVWAEVSRYWYSQCADLSPDDGLIQHNLAVIAWPDLLQLLFFYMKALVSVDSFHSARETVILFFEGQDLDQDTMITAFIATHRALFTQASRHGIISLASHFLTLIRREIRRLDAEGQQAVYIVSCNIALVLQYGAPGASPALQYFKRLEKTSIAEAHALALESEGRISDEYSEAGALIQPEVAYYGRYLAFHTLSIFLEQVDDPSIHPSLHLSMSFIWCMALHPPTMQRLESDIPWMRITDYLNSLFHPETVVSKIREPAFPILDNVPMQQLPEDFIIRGQAWSQLYYPDEFFKDAPPENDRPIIATPSAATWRRHRCLWLGVRIATFRRWIEYRDQVFFPIPLAQELSPIGELCGNLCGTDK